MSDLQMWIYFCRHLLLSNNACGEAVKEIMTYVVPAAVNMLAKWCPGSNGSSDEHADGSHEVCCPASNVLHGLIPIVLSVTNTGFVSCF